MCRAGVKHPFSPARSPSTSFGIGLLFYFGRPPERTPKYHSLWRDPINSTSPPWVNFWTEWNINQKRQQLGKDNYHQGSDKGWAGGRGFYLWAYLLLTWSPRFPQTFSLSCRQWWSPPASPQILQGIYKLQHGKWNHHACFLWACDSQEGGVGDRAGHQLPRLFFLIQSSD